MKKDKKKYNLLIVEDNPGDLLIVDDFLHEVIEQPVLTNVKNFKDARQILDKNEVSFDVILLDLTLPDKSGKQLIDEMLKVAGLSPIIILTGYADIDFSIQSISKSVSDYLIKEELSAITLYKSIIYTLERQKAIHQLLESEKRYSDLFHLSPQPMWVFDLETLHFLSVNDAAIRNYGYSEAEFLSMTLKDIRPPEDIPLMEEAVQLSKKHKELFTKGVYRHMTKAGTIMHVEIIGNIINFNGKKAELILANDITERVSYIKTIEEHNKRLHDIAFTQSHIVRVPLARMMGIVNLFKEMEEINSPRLQKLLTYFMDSADELDNLLKNIVTNAENEV